MNRTSLPALLVVSLLTTFALVTSAQAGSPKVFINGVDITGVADQEFANVEKVKIDSQGNIHLSAPQYQVEVQGGDPAAAQTPAPGTIATRFYLVGSNSRPGAVGYDVDVYVNGTLFRTLKNSDGQLVVELTDKLNRGANTITVKAKKLSGSRASTSNKDGIDIMVGQGNANGNQLTIDRQILSFRVDASQLADVSQNFTFDAQ